MKKVKTEHLANELTVNSSVFSKAKVNVIFQGDDAGTDGSTIVLPSLTQGGSSSRTRCSGSLVLVTRR